jgi:hypothetical protein
VPVQISSSNNSILNNYFHDCYAVSYDYGYDGGGVEFFEEGVPIENNIIAYNTMYDCNGCFEFGSSSDGVANNLISNNQIYYNKIINSSSLFYINNNGQYKTDVRNLQFYNNVILYMEVLRQLYGGNRKYEEFFVQNSNDIFYDMVKSLKTILALKFNTPSLSESSIRSICTDLTKESMQVTVEKYLTKLNMDMDTSENVLSYLSHVKDHKKAFIFSSFTRESFDKIWTVRIGYAFTPTTETSDTSVVSTWSRAVYTLTLPEVPNTRDSTSILSDQIPIDLFESSSIGRSNGYSSRSQFEGRSNGYSSRSKFEGRSNGYSSRSQFEGRSNEYSYGPKFEGRSNKYSYEPQSTERSNRTQSTRRFNGYSSGSQDRGTTQLDSASSGNWSRGGK